jgi:hypothetical protein
MKASTIKVEGVLRVGKEILRPEIWAGATSRLVRWERHGGSALKRTAQSKTSEAGSWWFRRFLEWHCNQWCPRRFYHGTKADLCWW